VGRFSIDAPVVGGSPHRAPCCLFAGTFPDARTFQGRIEDSGGAPEDDDFESICAEVRLVRSLRRGEWQPRILTWTRLTCSEDHFRLVAELDAYDGEQRICSRNWDRRIARRCV
jgi:hypothetical protein